MLIYKHLEEENNEYFVYMNTQGNKTVNLQSENMIQIKQIILVL